MKSLAFGEILYDVDVENDISTIGGASLNFAAHLSLFGEDSYILSSVGNDKLGSDALKTIDDLGLKRKYVSVNNDYQTGKAIVTYNNGEPSYDLSMISAYDNIMVSNLDEIKNEGFNVFYFGTLAQRNDCSRETLYKILNNVKFDIVFYDVNLRQSYYSDEIIKSGLKQANIVKVNREEIKYIMDMESLNTDDYKTICQKYNIDYLIITMDKDGAYTYDKANDKLHFAPSKKEKLISAVGAGDSFSACFIHNIYNNIDIENCIKRANILGAYVIGFKDSVPKYTEELLDTIKVK